MAFTYGFYNYEASDVDPKLYDAEQISQLFDGIITDGIYAHIGTCFAVYAPPDNVASTVIIGSGRAWFNHTWTYNSSNYVLDGAPPKPSFYNRIDAVVIDVNKDSRNRHNSLSWITGTESETPTNPIITNTTTHSQHVLAYILRTPTDNNIISGTAITKVVGTDETPFVTGVLESLSAEELLADLEGDFVSMANSWQRQFTSLVSDCQGDFDSWFNTSKSSFTSFMDSSNSTFTTFMNGIKHDYDELLAEDTEKINTWLAETKETYDAWFENLTIDLADTPISQNQCNQLTILWAT